jgi:predicted nucleotidyltransferase
VKRDEILEILAENKKILSAEFGVKELSLFGSMARDEAHDESDLDVLVVFNGPATSKRYFGVQFYLEDLFGCDVDLVTDKALRPEIRPHVERDAIRV